MKKGVVSYCMLGTIEISDCGKFCGDNCPSMERPHNNDAICKYMQGRLVIRDEKTGLFHRKPSCIDREEKGMR